MHAQKGTYPQRISFLDEEQDGDAHPRFPSDDSFARERWVGLIALVPIKQALFPKCWDEPLFKYQKHITGEDAMEMECKRLTDYW